MTGTLTMTADLARQYKAIQPETEGTIMLSSSALQPMSKNGDAVADAAPHNNMAAEVSVS